MNKTLVGLVLTALLIGLGGGYVLGYVIYQPQLQNLQNNLSSLSDDLDSLNATLLEVISDYADNLSDYQDQVSEEARLTSDRLNAINSSLANAQLLLATLQNQLASLNSKLASLNSTVEAMENRSWHEVYSVSASSNVTSGIFQLKGKEFRVMLTAWGQDALSWITIALRFSNGTLCSYFGFSGIWTATNVEEDLAESGEYYLDIVSYQMDYDLVFWDYY